MEEIRKSLDRTRLEQGALQSEEVRRASRPKEGKSFFDEMLEQKRNSASAQPLTLKEASTSKEALRAGEKFQERLKEKPKEKEKENSEEEKKKSREEGRSGDDPKRVVGKQGDKKNQEGGGDAKGGNEGGAKGGRRNAPDAKKASAEETRLSQGLGQACRTFTAKLAKAGTLPKTLSRELLEQIVRHVRIRLNRKKEVEVELDLHRDVFQGLRLRLSENRGKVRLHFLAADPEVRELFRRERGAIREALLLKGVAVEEIRVI